MNKKFFTKAQNEKGAIGIMMLLSAIAILTPIIVNFTFDTYINQFKVYNIEDRARAKLNAESGLQFAMARLRLYKEAYNYIQKNDAAKDVVKPEKLDMLWNIPFVYPIPEGKDLNRAQKDTIAKFHDETFIEGKMQISIDNISNKINLNMLRLSLLADMSKKLNEGKTGEDGDDTETDPEENQEFNVETQVFKALQNAIEKESDKDEAFAGEYSGTDLDVLLNELKYYVSDPNSIEDTAGADANFQSNDLVPKKAPFASFSEIYTLPGWQDDITNLIKNEFTIHGALMVDLNKITDKLLKLLIPNITEEEIKEFFEYKNDEEDPKHFNSLDDFKNYIVKVGNVMTDSEFDERFKKFETEGLKFGPTPTLFKVIAVGMYERATYTLTAYVTLPAQPEPRKLETEGEEGEEGEEENSTATNNTTENNNSSENTTGENGNESGEETKKKTQLLEPRIIEIVIN